MKRIKKHTHGVSNVNKVRAYYFLQYIATSMIIVFLPLYLTHLGKSETEVGTYLSISLFALIGAQFVWRMIMKFIPSKRHILMLSSVGFAAAGAMMIFMHGPIGLIAAIIFIKLFEGAIVPYTEFVAYEVSETENKGFAGIRIFGAVGLMTAIFVGGVVVEKWHQYNYMFFIIIAVSLIALIFITIIRPNEKVHHDIKGKEGKGKLFPGWVIIFLIAFTLTESVGLVVDAFYSIYFVGDQVGYLNQGEALYATLHSISVLIEVLIVAVFAKQMSKVTDKGAMRFMVLAGLLLALRSLITGFTDNTNIIIAVSFFRGISMTFIIIYTVSTLDALGKRKALDYSLSLRMLIPTLGTALMYPFMGSLFETQGPELFFTIAGILQVVGFSLMIIIYLRHKDDRLAGATVREVH